MAKRKRDILDGFDPNKSDSEDENFDPSEAQVAVPRKKKSRSSQAKSTSRRKSNRYRGSDISDEEGDEDVSDSMGENSYDEDEDEEEEEAPVGATGRRMRKVATTHKSYKESSEEEGSVVADSDVGADAPQRRSSKQPSKIVVLKTNPKNLRGKARGIEKTPAQPVRRTTRARTEETEEPLVELSRSGRHARVSRASRSRSPESMARPLRATRGAKGIKKLPAQPPVEEVPQETEAKEEREDFADELAGNGEQEDANDGDDEDKEMNEDAEVAEEAREVADSSNEQADDQPDVEEVAGDVVVNDQAAQDDDDDDDVPITRKTRASRAKAAAVLASGEEEEADDESRADQPGRSLRRGTRSRTKKSTQEPSSDFEPAEESGDGDGSGSERGKKRPVEEEEENEDKSSSQATPRRGRSTRRSMRRRNQDSADEEIELDKDEMAEELEELRQSSHSRPRRRPKRKSPPIEYEEPTRRRVRKPINYTIPALDPLQLASEDDQGNPATTPARGGGGRRRNGASAVWERPLNTTYGPFGGGGGNGSLLGGPWGTGATGGVDSDSSDDEGNRRSGSGGTVGMTPTSAAPPVGVFGVAAQAHNDGGLQGIGGATPNVGKVKNQKAFADADPLGVDMSVDFSKVGGLEGHIDQLKEMVQLPLLYPELFSKFHLTPPRGVLFHGPPGTGKTLLARALANSIGSGGRKITFYMRKGADALSKWVGEAEKQLRLLFEEARRTQPSIIFFDEIDGLAPVRSSKQEQIHASIVSTLLALMDGMDGRGQVIVIGATNRPDNIDPALRRPGRFDREFYFPLPDVDSRRAILDIHTKDWGLKDDFKRHLAENTKGYGGADLRALCTEAALNSIQRTYPQIYSSKEKLIVDPAKISIHATDFTISMKKMVPSSERSTSSAAAPLPATVEPLLRSQFRSLVKILDDVFPRNKKTTALEEAMFEPHNDEDHGFGREAMQQEFERVRIFRPRLLITGLPGMGQQYLASAVLHHLEGVHVQSFDLAGLLGDGRPLEQVIVSNFVEVKRRKPSVLLVPDIDSWWTSLGEGAITTFISMLKTIPPTDPVLLLATSELLPDQLPEDLRNSLFGFSKKNRTVVCRPGKDNRFEFFKSAVDNIRKSPKDFPDPANRKRRQLEELEVAPPPPPKIPTKEEIKAQRKADLHNLNQLKMRLQPIMDQIHRKYRKFRQPVIPVQHLDYLFAESEPNFVRADVAEGVERRPFELAKDKDGTDGIRDVATGKFFYNLETTTIEERLANGYYARPMDFYNDINKLYRDAKNIGDRERLLKAQELLTNVEVDVTDIENFLTAQGIRFDEIHQRQLQRAKEAEEKARKRQAMRTVVGMVQTDMMAGNDSDSPGPVGMALSVNTTTARFAVMSPLAEEHGGADTSGSHAVTNGTSVPSRINDEDVQMGGTGKDTRPLSSGHENMGPPTTFARGGRPSVGAAQTPVQTGVSPSGIHNDESTTRSSEPSQFTNGAHVNSQDLSQLPDTQPQTASSGHSQTTSSGGPWAHSQAQALLQGHSLPGYRGANSSSSSNQRRSSANVTNLGSILNDDTSNDLSTQMPDSSPSQQPLVEEARIKDFHWDLVSQTSGCSIEQLEQINRELMEGLWRTRHEWNRVNVTSTLTTVFNEVMRDIQSLQGPLQLSQEDERDGPWVYLK